MTQSIRVSCGNAHTYLDNNDYVRAKDFHWHKTQNGYVAGTVLEQGVRKRVYLHRWLLDAQPGHGPLWTDRYRAAHAAWPLAEKVRRW